MIEKSGSALPKIGVYLIDFTDNMRYFDQMENHKNGYYICIHHKCLVKI